MKIYLVIEKGPNGEHILAFRTLEEAKKLVSLSSEYWSAFVINDVPPRTYTIKTFEEI